MNDKEYKELFDELENRNSHFGCGVLMAARYGTAKEFIEIFEACVLHMENHDRLASNNACSTLNMIMNDIRRRENIYPLYPKK